MQVILLTPDELKQIISDAVCVGVSQAMQSAPAAKENEPYLTIKEAAALLRCSTRHIYSLLSDGKLRKYIISGKTLLLKKEVATAPKAI